MARLLTRLLARFLLRRLVLWLASAPAGSLSYAPARAMAGSLARWPFAPSHAPAGSVAGPFAYLLPSSLFFCSNWRWRGWPARPARSPARSLARLLARFLLLRLAVWLARAPARSLLFRLHGR